MECACVVWKHGRFQRLDCLLRDQDHPGNQVRLSPACLAPSEVEALQHSPLPGGPELEGEVQVGFLCASEAVLFGDLEFCVYWTMSEVPLWRGGCGVYIAEKVSLLVPGGRSRDSPRRRGVLRIPAVSCRSRDPFQPRIPEVASFLRRVRVAFIP